MFSFLLSPYAVVIVVVLSADDVVAIIVNVIFVVIPPAVVVFGQRTIQSIRLVPSRAPAPQALAPFGLRAPFPHDP